ncbi:S8 family serine peptidase [Fibrella sp. HMF5335]|uniref:S8 family serine peptidase n=1 Tax=Fibrella rubiginis TaxID=2817060 RepID=A0A939GB55_9BACT|nr:S8 family serine peptidase [Fibrella rubiginis]MBO0935644.1 S8 family serine peptidase [Fibrella rubiginis]
MAAQSQQARKAVSGYDLGQHGLQAARLRYPSLTGAGLVVSVKEQPFDTSDIDFRGRVVISRALAKSFTDHASTMTTLLAGAGNTAPSSRGVAWGVRLVSSSYDRLAPDTLPDLRSQGVSIQNHSYGVGIERLYGPDARAYDRQVIEQPTLLHVFSSGNSGLELPRNGPLPGPFMTLTGEFKQAKNTLVVGGISSRGVLEARSSRGPTVDGRLKPELVAYGDNGTSESAALVSGVAALLQQSYRDKEGTLPTVAWVKACLIASCEDIDLPGPDHSAGFGNLDALGAVTLAQRNQYKTGTVTGGNTQSFTLVVPPNMARLAVALAWNDTPATTAALRQNLDLLLDLPNGTTIRPWVLSAALHPDSVTLPARRGTDRVNNAEQASVQNPIPGVYRIRVVGTALPDGPQAYAVAYTLDSVLTWFNPTGGAVLTAGEAQPIRWLWRGDKALRGTLSVQTAGETNWQPIAEDIRLADQLAWWTPPNRTQTARFRVVSDAGTFLSDTCAVAQTTRLRVVLNCPNLAAVSWRRQPGVVAYQVYKLGTQYLEPLRQTTDTVAFLTPADGLYVAVAPILAGRPTQPGFTINYQLQGVECYVSTWLARQTVADTARLDFTLSTAWNLRSLTFERATSAQGFVSLATLTPTASQLNYTFTDRPPTTGTVRYRIRITTQTGETILTDEETVYHIQANEQFLFPNPVAAGRPVTVVIQAPDGIGTWISPNGQREKSARLTGTVKEMPTTNLATGLHFLRVIDSAGVQHITPVLIQ